MTQFLDLPPEILIEILALLNITNIFSCVRTCRLLDELIGNSCKLQYLTQLKLAGMQDNPYCSLSTAERLDALKHREIAWQSFNWKFLTTVDVPYKSSGVYDVTPSVYLLGKSGTDLDLFTAGIQSVKLPSQFPDESESVSVEWNEFDFGMNIIDFGTSIEEHDLLACVSSVPDQDDPTQCHIVVVLLRYSTKKTHDACQNPVITICRASTRQGPPSISIEVVGENLAVIVVFNRDLTTSSDYMYIYDWKTGKKKSEPLQIYNPGLTFLREDILINPNIVRKSLDIYHIAPSSAIPAASSSTTPPQAVRLIHSLLLPPLKTGQHITNVSCRCDPNPTSNGFFPKYTRKSRPYAHDPAEAILILTLEIRPFTREVSRSFVMIVHRKALLDLIPPVRSFGHNPWVGPYDSNGKPKAKPGLLTRQSTQGLGRQDTLSMSLVQWPVWGPPVTRWFNADDFSTVFITTTSGQRCVQFTPYARSETPGQGEADETPDTVHILDFNPWHVKIARHLSDSFNVGVFGLVGKEPSSTTAPFRSEDMDVDVEANEPEENICFGHGAFAEDIVGRLPYLVRTSEERWDYDAVLMDEERLLGLREQSEPDTYRIENIDVVYFG